MVQALVDWAAAHGTRTTMLIASPEVVPFCQVLGFSPTPQPPDEAHAEH